jgi:outer membrane receptor protein involved in Fe transport
MAQRQVQLWRGLSARQGGQRAKRHHAAGRRELPLKRFPDTTETSTALFAQAELHYGAFSLTPGLRAEHYSIKPKQQGFGGTAVSNSTPPSRPSWAPCSR